MISAKFIINNKIYLITKVSPFIENYERELRIKIDIKRIGKIEKAMEFAKRIQKVQEKAGAVLNRA